MSRPPSLDPSLFADEGAGCRRIVALVLASWAALAALLWFLWRSL